jgi:hypothetical protein
MQLAGIRIAHNDSTVTIHYYNIQSLEHWKKKIFSNFTLLTALQKKLENKSSIKYWNVMKRSRKQNNIFQWE